MIIILLWPADDVDALIFLPRRFNYDEFSADDSFYFSGQHINTNIHLVLFSSSFCKQINLGMRKTNLKCHVTEIFSSGHIKKLNDNVILIRTHQNSYLLFRSTVTGGTWMLAHLLWTSSD